MSIPRLRLARAASVAVRRGHPWVWREAIARQPRDLHAGAPVELVDEAGVCLARGLWDASSPIAARVYLRGPGPPLDARAIAGLVEGAAALRDRMFQGDATDAYRLCNGEGDRVPALVLDRYASLAVMRIDGELLAPWVERLVDPVSRLLSGRGITTLALRVEADPGGSRLRVLYGPPPPERLFVREHGMAMEVDPWRGQKTGAFLDQRENRARVRVLARGRDRVLNLFSYAGGFSVAAALGGARQVTSVDTAAAAHASAQRSFRENGLSPDTHAFVTADVFDFLARAAARKDRYDLVISDPPSFAPNERARPRAMTAYRKLHAAAAAVLAEGGVLCAASCSSHVDAEAFASTLDDAALGDSKLRLLELLGQPADHPTLPAWPEGRYLKFAILA